MTFHFTFQLILQYRIRTDSVKVSMFVSSAVDRGFKRRSGQTKACNWYTPLHLKACNIRELEQRLFVSESG
jgi:hypothetical protein